MKQPIPRAARVCCPLLLVVLLLPLLLPLVLATAGCKSRKVNVAATDEETPRMASALNMGDPKSEPQLVTGLFDNQQRSKRRLITYDDMPTPLIDAVLAIEDRRFFQHSGINYWRCVRHSAHRRKARA